MSTFITDEYNPYCSKWGYCISYNLFGEEGPGQSKGAVEDGTRGQCRDDNDCTPWAPSCSPLGYCRGSPEEWDWDGSFGSPTNPKPGGPQSDWVKKNAKSGGARNEDYYKKIEDDNRAAHVKFRKENPIFYEQIPELLPRLEKIENNVYSNCTYCTYDPKSDSKYQDLVARLSGNQRKNGNNNRQSTGNSRRNNQKPRNNRRVTNQGNNRQNNRNNGNNNRRKNNGQRNQQNNGNRRKNQQTNGRRAQQNNGNGRKNQQNASNRCPDGSLQKCKAICASFSGNIKKACENNCTKRCS